MVESGHYIPQIGNQKIICIIHFTSFKLIDDIS